MKICPACGHANDDDNFYCVVDGAALGAARIFVPLDEPEAEVATRGVPKPPSPAVSPAANAPRPVFIYALLGALGSAVVILGAYVLIVPRNGGGSTTSNNSTISTPQSNAAADTNLAAAKAMKAAINAANAVQTNTTANKLANVPRGASRAESRFEHTYEGMVGNNNVVMNLTRNGNSLTGRVMPDGRYAEIYLDGYIYDDGSFSMDEKSDIGVKTGFYSGRLNSDGTLTGTWSKPDGGKTRSVYLTRR